MGYSLNGYKGATQAISYLLIGYKGATQAICLSFIGYKGATRAICCITNGYKGATQEKSFLLFLLVGSQPYQQILLFGAKKKGNNWRGKFLYSRLIRSTLSGTPTTYPLPPFNNCVTAGKWFNWNNKIKSKQL